jgi:hypothetical protein
MADTEYTREQHQAVAVPLIEQLRSVPRDAVLRIDAPNALNCMDTRSIPVGRLCHEAAAALPSASLGEQRGAPQRHSGWVRLADSDWVNIVNHPEVLGHGNDADLAVACAVRLTEVRLRELNTMLAASPASKSAGGGGERDAGGVSASGLTQQLVRAVEASDEGHDPFCMAILRGKDCSCGFDQRAEGAAGPLGTSPDQQKGGA